MTAARLRCWFLAAALVLGLALPATTSCSGTRGGRRHSPRVKTQRGKKPVRSHRPSRTRSRHPRHARHPHAHPHPHSASTHHHHSHPHPHLEGPDGHHHPF